MSPVVLKPNDRIIFGTGQAFLYRNQSRVGEASVQDTAEKPIEYAFALNEKLEAERRKTKNDQEAERKKQEEEIARQMKELQDKMEADKRA